MDITFYGLVYLLQFKVFYLMLFKLFYIFVHDLIQHFALVFIANVVILQDVLGGAE